MGTPSVRLDMQKALLALPFLAGVLVHQTSHPSEFKDYTRWHLVTPQPVDMHPTIALSCIGPMKEDQPPNPHVPRVFRVFVNDKGKAASEGKKTTYPVGSILLKEKFVRPETELGSPAKLPKDAKPELLTAMVKRKKGFAPEVGDWEFFVLSGDAKRQTNKDLHYCVSCHQSRKASDFVFGGYGKLLR